MEFQEFVTKLAEQFEETDTSAFAANTEFKQLAEWSSMMALSIIAMADEEYDVRIKGDDLRSSTTIADLYEIVKSRKNA